jgi:ABC-type uncharacterized transport system involved in gliding motility auxiliary subunit
MNYAFALEEEDTRGSKILGLTLEGIFPSWFRMVDKPDAEGRPLLPDLPREARESRIVVIGDSDLPGVLMQYTQSQRNLDFILQTADWIGNDDDIVGIRNRRSDTGRLDRISDDAKRKGAMGFATILNVVLIPLAIVIFGIARALKRRPGKEQGNAA